MTTFLGVPLNFALVALLLCLSIFPMRCSNLLPGVLEWVVCKPGGCQRPQSQRREEDGILRSRYTLCFNPPVCFLTVCPCLHLCLNS